VPVVVPVEQSSRSVATFEPVTSGAMACSAILVVPCRDSRVVASWRRPSSRAPALSTPGWLPPRHPPATRDAVRQRLPEKQVRSAGSNAAHLYGLA
jgi:hypothetical protein